MVFERTKAGEVLALARLLNVKEVRLIADAARYQPCIKWLDEITDETYEKLVEDLTRFAKLKAEGEVDDFDEMLYGCDDDDDGDLEKQMDKWEMQYHYAELRAEAAIDAAALKYGYYDR